MLPLPIRTGAYWTQFKITEADLEFLYNLFLEEETPLRTPELIRRLIAFRIENEVRDIQKQWAKGDIYQPALAYEVGKELVFPTLNLAAGKVIAARPGENPEHGDFSVIKVQFEDGKEREFASNLKTDHPLNVDVTADIEEEQPDPARVYQRYKRVLTPIVVDVLRADNDMVFIAGRWFLKSLLLDVNTGFLNLAEAVLDLSDGGPLETLEIANQIGLGDKANPILRSVSLDYALSKDDRFDEVGPAGKVWWFLHRMEPAEIKTPPTLLRYDSIPYNPNLLTDEMLNLVEELDDEHSNLEIEEDDDEADSITITLTYPHWRMGTLPLTQRVEYLFPTAYRAPRIKMTLVDKHAKEEVDGWVVRDFGYVYGLGDFYQRHHLPIGAYITISQDDDPSRLIVDFASYKPRSEWLWQAEVEENRLHFKESQQMIGAKFDPLMLLGVGDQAKLDALAERYRTTRRELTGVMTELMGELAQFSPQGHVHCKTLYSAVNMLLRCPPAPIFATLQNHPNFVNAGGPFWKLA